MDMEQKKPIALKGLRAGDEFRTIGNNRIAPQRGKILKINRVNLTYEAHYCPAPGVDELMTLKTEKRELIGARVLRGNELFEVAE